MPIDRNFKKYHESIAAELRTTKDRMRFLIGDQHWLSDGEHKEAVLRRILRNYVAQSFEIGSGFVCCNNHTSTQIDILITRRDRPTLFRDGEIFLVTPDAVAAIIEVKTRLQMPIQSVLEKLADNIEMVRDAGNPDAVAGLFVYEDYKNHDRHQHLLKAIQKACKGNPNRVINWVAAGSDLFVRYWHDGRVINNPNDGPAWNSYLLQDLSHAYFVSNVVWDICPNLDRSMQFAWFPIEGGKECYRKQYIGLKEEVSHSFNPS